MRGVVPLAVGALFAFLCAGAAPADAPDPWEPLRALAGTWEGTGRGFGGESAVTHTWSHVLDGNFLELRTRSVARRDGKPDEVHEDVGYVSRDTAKDAFVFRQFLSEGYVNTFDLAVDGDADARVIRFEYREAESAGGMRARMQLAFSGPDAYAMDLELAAPGKDFAVCQQMRMARAK